jgi:regulator of sirC expression with transglutaminase-like and TPR domain
MVNNLKGSYFRRRNFSKVLTMIELSLAIDPGGRETLRERGMVYFLMSRHAEAMADLGAYLKLAPPDDPEVKEVRTTLQRIRAMMN